MRTAFGSTRIREQTFSMVKIEKINIVNDIDEQLNTVLRLSTSNMKADLNENLESRKHLYPLTIKN